MTTSPFDSSYLGGLFADAQTRALFSDSAEIRAMLLVEGALARVQGQAGLIPPESGEAIWRAAREIQIDPAALAPETARSAVVIPALVDAFRTAMQAPEHAQYVHWGATSQDIIDTAMMLRLRPLVHMARTRLATIVGALGALARTHAHLPMPARTWGQVATPTSFGAIVAGWGAPLIGQIGQLDSLRPRLLRVSLSGAAGTASALGNDPAALRRALALELGLHDDPQPWHSNRAALAAFAGWATITTGSLGKMGRDLDLMAQSGIEEIVLGQGGGSSTMPQKSNPVLPALLVALARHISALNGAMQDALVHAQQRDGAAWMAEWLALPQICMGLARSLGVAHDLAGQISPRPENMRANLEAGGGLIHAEALSFAIEAQAGLPRPQAQAAVKELCHQARAEGRPLADIAAGAWPGLDLGATFTPETQLGTAPDIALAFAEEAGKLEAAQTASSAKAPQ